MTAKVTYYTVAGLNKSIRKLPKEAKAKLRDGSERIAKKVAADAAGRARSQGGVAALVAPTIRSGRSTVPVVKMGDSSPLPNAGGGWERERKGKRQTIGDVIWGAEFGGGKYRKGRPTRDGGYTSQFLPWRGNDTGAGYFLWPAVRGDREFIADAYEDAMADAEKAAFKGEKKP